MDQEQHSGIIKQDCDNTRLSLKKRLLLYSGAWLAAVLYLWRYIDGWQVFPLGLPFIDWMNFGGKSVLWAGWSIYAAHVILSFLSNRKVYFYVFYAILIILLVSNVHGCQHMLVKGVE